MSRSISRPKSRRRPHIALGLALGFASGLTACRQPSLTFTAEPETPSSSQEQIIEEQDPEAELPFPLECDCDYFTSFGTRQFDAQSKGVQPGDTICVRGGGPSYDQPITTGLKFDNVQGTAESPILIRNCGCKVSIQYTGASAAVDFYRSSHFRMTGFTFADGSAGIEIEGGNNGIKAFRSSDFELDHMKVSNASGIGINAKTDPSCDPTTWRKTAENPTGFVMSNVIFHHLEVKNVGQEGFYIGNSHYRTGAVRTCDGENITILEHDVNGVEVYDNSITSTGRDGIQVGSAVGGALITRNKVNGVCSMLDFNLCAAGIQLNSGTIATVSHNWVQGNPSWGNWGIQSIASGGTMIFNNVILDATFGGIMTKDSVILPGESLRIFNNTFVRLGRYGIDAVNSQDMDVEFFNNIIAGITPGSNTTYKFINQHSNTELFEENNLFEEAITSAGFIDADANDFRLHSLSPAVNAGKSVEIQSVPTDYLGAPRTVGGVPDIGAYERQ